MKPACSGLVPFAIALSIAVASCEMETAPPACSAATPAPSAFLHDPAFRSLGYHKRVDYDIIRGLGYDLWADSRFIYRTGLEFTLVPEKGASNEDQLCAQAVALRMALPVDAGGREKLDAFVRIAAAGRKLDGARLRSALAERLASGEKYGPVATESGVSVEGGKVTHPSRGEFFVVAFGWLPQ